MSGKFGRVTGSESWRFAQSFDVGLCASCCGDDMRPWRLGSTVKSFGNRELRQGRRRVCLGASRLEARYAWLIMTSESSSRESHDPPAFGGEDTKSEEPSQYVCSEGESSETKVVVEGVIESRMVVYEGERGEPSVDSGSAAYREMQRNYKVLEAITD
ncbi:unnamed protein product [Prunus armeniaca]